MTNRVLLSGSTGFIGQQILQVLKASGIDTRLIIRSDRMKQAPSNTNATLYTQNLFSENSKWLNQACEGIDTIIHCAWYVEAGKYLRSDQNVDCLTGTLNLAKAAVRMGVRRFVGIGTCLEYQSSDCQLTVDNPLAPRTPYAAAKAAVYMMLSQYLAEHNVEFAWCRVFYLFGENEDSKRLFPYVRSQLKAGKYVDLTSGNQIRDYLDVKIAGKMIAEVAMGQGQGAFNICSGKPTTIRQLVEEMADGYNARHLLRFGAKLEGPNEPNCIWGKAN
jgi:nucleoside-diphosphate-sugar epimerase